MTEQLLSSNPSSVLEEKKRKQTKKNVGGREDDWHEVAVASGSDQCNRFGFREPNIQDCRFIVAAAFTRETSKGWFGGPFWRSPLFCVSKVTATGWISALWIPKQRGKEKTSWVFLSTSNLSIRVGGDSSFYLRGWEELQRGGGELINPPLCLQLSFES